MTTATLSALPPPIHKRRHYPLSRLRPIQTPAISTNKHLFNLDRVLDTKPPPPPQLAHDASQLPLASAAIPHRRGFLDALNLTSVFRRSADDIDMSPRSLSHLQRLLSDSPRPSPKNPIASRWQDFHGRHDWSGLLDPLHPDLRRELLHCGDFIGAAYRAFHTNPSFPAISSIPDRSYRFTRNLYTTSSLNFPDWAKPLAPVPWMAAQSSWAGFVAICDHEREIHRMGRRDIIISLRGTSTYLEWAENFRASLVPITDQLSAPKVECGFLSLFKTPGPNVPSLADAVVDEVLRLIDTHAGEELSITITGHSLGAALALLTADELSSRIPHLPPTAVFSFGGPRVGNKAFAERVEKKGVKVLRVVNAHDMVTKVPGVFPVVGDGYADVGRELRLDSKASPYLKPEADPGCCHDLEAYLHLVDGFKGSGCPFRSDARRSIARLVAQQRSNVKRVCVAKAGEIRSGPIGPGRSNIPACPSQLVNQSTN